MGGLAMIWYYVLIAKSTFGFLEYKRGVLFPIFLGMLFVKRFLSSSKTPDLC